MELQSLSTLGEGDKQKEAEVQLLPMPFVQSHVTFESFFAAKILLKYEETCKWPLGTIILCLFGDCFSPLKSDLFTFASLVSFFVEHQNFF